MRPDYRPRQLWKLKPFTRAHSTKSGKRGYTRQQNKKEIRNAY